MPDEGEFHWAILSEKSVKLGIIFGYINEFGAVKHHDNHHILTVSPVPGFLLFLTLQITSNGT